MLSPQGPCCSLGRPSFCSSVSLAPCSDAPSPVHPVTSASSIPDNCARALHRHRPLPPPIGRGLLPSRPSAGLAPAGANGEKSFLSLAWFWPGNTPNYSLVTRNERPSHLQSQDSSCKWPATFLKENRTTVPGVAGGQERLPGRGIKSTSLNLNPTLPPTSCVNLGKLPNLSES